MSTAQFCNTCTILKPWKLTSVMNSKVRYKVQLGEPVRSCLLGGEVGYLPGRTSKKLESRAYKVSYLYYSKGMTSLKEGKGRRHLSDIMQNKLEESEVILRS